MKVVFDHKQDEASNIETFYFKAESPVQYIAGQFAEWTLKHADPDDRGIKRWFTISSSPTDEFVTITTKFADKPSSFKKALLCLKPDDEILMSDAMGDFVLPKNPEIPLIFVAGGIGITPFHSILSWLKANGKSRNIKLIYGVGVKSEIAFSDLLAQLDIDVSIVIESLSAELIIDVGRPTNDSLVYVSGPEPMVETLETDLKKLGIRPDQFVGDFFPNYTTI